MRVPLSSARAAKGKCRREKQRAGSGDEKVDGVGNEDIQGWNPCSSAAPRSLSAAVQVAAPVQGIPGRGTRPALTSMAALAAAAAAVAAAVAVSLTPGRLAAVPQANDRLAHRRASGGWRIVRRGWRSGLIVFDWLPIRADDAIDRRPRVGGTPGAGCGIGGAPSGSRRAGERLVPALDEPATPKVVGRASSRTQRKASPESRCDRSGSAIRRSHAPPAPGSH